MSVPALALFENCVRPVNAPLTVVCEILRDPGIVRDPHAADGKRDRRRGGDGIGSKACAEAEDDAVHLRIGRERDRGGVR